MIEAGASPCLCRPAGRAARNVPSNARTAPRRALRGRRRDRRAV